MMGIKKYKVGGVAKAITKKKPKPKKIKTDKSDLFDATNNLDLEIYNLNNPNKKRLRARAPIFFGPYKPEQYIDADENNKKFK